MTYIEGSKSLIEIAGNCSRLASTVRMEAERRGLEIVTDWKGNPALSEADAAELLAELQGRDVESARRNARLNELANSFGQRRHEAVNAARRKARAELLDRKGPRWSGMFGRDEVDEAGQKAGREFERQTPAELQNRVIFKYLWVGRGDRPPKGRRREAEAVDAG